MDDYYYLTADDVRHYEYMLARGYPRKVVCAASQKYLVFQIVDKPDIGVAWPTITGGLDGVTIGDVLLQVYEPMQRKIMPLVSGSTLRILLFPRYVGS